MFCCSPGRSGMAKKRRGEGEGRGAQCWPASQASQIARASQGPKAIRRCGRGRSPRRRGRRRRRRRGRRGRFQPSQAPPAAKSLASPGPGRPAPQPKVERAEQSQHGVAGGGAERVRRQALGRDERGPRKARGDERQAQPVRDAEVLRSMTAMASSRAPRNAPPGVKRRAPPRRGACRERVPARHRRDPGRVAREMAALEQAVHRLHRVAAADGGADPVEIGRDPDP